MGVNSIRSNDTARVRMDKYTKYINELNKSFALLRAESSRNIVQEKIQNAEKTIISIQKNMIENYNRWAIERIDELYTHYDKNIDKLTKSFRKEDDIVRVLDDYLSNIDPSLLSHPATQIYNEILSLLYGKLDAENKIKVSRMLNNATKRGLD